MVGLGLVLAAHARAQDALPLQLTWQAPAECGTAEDVRAELQRIARARPGYALPALTARARVERGGAGYAATLVTEHEGELGERQLDAADCPTLVKSVTLVLALAFGRGVEVADARRATGPAVGESVEAAPGAERGDARDDEGDRARDAGAEASDGVRGRALRPALLLGAGLELTLLPEVAGHLALGVELAAGAWSVSLRAGAWPGVRTRLASGLDARFDGLSGALQGCGALPFARVELALCAGTLAAALRGRSKGAFEDGTDTAPWLALAAAAAATWPAHSLLALRLEATLAASLVRPRFVIAGFRPVHRVPALAPQLGALLLITP